MPKTERLKTIIRGLHIFAADGFMSKKAHSTGTLRVLPIITAQSIMWKTAYSIGIIRGLRSLGAINGTMLKTVQLKTTIRVLCTSATDGFTLRKVPLTGIIQVLQITTAHGTMWKRAF